MNSFRIKLLIIAVLLGVVGWLVWRPQPSEAQGPNPTLFVRGFVAVSVATPTAGAVITPREVFLPNAKVFLVPFNDLTHPVASTITDLSGRFALKTNKSATFTICVEAEGFARFCAPNEFRLTKVSKYYGTLRLPIPQDARNATTYGRVILGDGSTARALRRPSLRAPRPLRLSAPQLQRGPACRTRGSRGQLQHRP